MPVAGVSGVIVANGVGVIVNPQGQLGTVVSSERFKSASPCVTQGNDRIVYFAERLIVPPIRARFHQRRNVHYLKCGVFDV